MTFRPSWNRPLSVPAVLALLAVGTFATGTDAFVLNGLLPAIATDLHVRLDTAGMLVTTFSVTFAVAAPLVAAFTGAWDRRRLLLSAQLLFVVGMAVQASGTTFAVVLVGRVLAAIGAAGYTSNAAAVGSSLVTPERRGSALAVVVGGMTVATVLGVPLGVLLGSWLGWRATVVAIAGLGLVAAAGTFAVPKVVLPAMGLRDRLAVLARPGVIRVLVVTVAIMTAAFTVSTYLPVVVAPVAAGAVLAWVFFANGGAAVVGNAVGGRWTDRSGPLVVLRVACLGLIVALALLPLATMSLATLLVTVAVWGASNWMTTVPQQHRLLALAPEAAPVMLGWNASAIYVGAALGSLLGGAVLHASSPAWLGPVGAVAALAALLLTWLRVPTVRHESVQPSVPSTASAART